MSINWRQWLAKNRLQILLLVVLVLAAYLNSLPNPFVTDDLYIIANNKELDQPSFFLNNPPVFLHSFILYGTNQLFGRLPAAFRLVNIFWHLGSTLALYAIVTLIVNQPVALLSSAIFAVHPLQSEAVTWISGGSYSQFTFFLLLSFLGFILSAKDKRMYTLSIISYLASLFSSEKAIVLPFILLAYLISFGDIRKDWKKTLPFFILSGIWTSSFFLKIGKRYADIQNLNYEKPRSFNPIFQIPIAISSYLILIFFPKNLTIYHTELTFTSWQFLPQVTVVILLVAGLIIAFKRHPQLFFWLTFFLISLSPTLTPFGLSWVVAERYAYLGAIGIYVLVAIFITKLENNHKLQPLVKIFSIIILGALLTRTIIRNRDWQNEDTLWLATAKTSPSSHVNHNNLGNMYSRQGKFDQAAAEFKKAIEINPEYSPSYHNLALVYRQQGKLNLAVINYQKALSLNPNLWQSYQNLAAIYYDWGRLPLAVESLQKAILINPNDSNLHTSLGYIFIKMGQFGQAEKEFSEAIRLDSNNERAKEGLIISRR